jgi:hypothetical protein
VVAVQAGDAGNLLLWPGGERDHRAGEHATACRAALPSPEAVQQLLARVRVETRALKKAIPSSRTGVWHAVCRPRRDVRAASAASSPRWAGGTYSGLHCNSQSTPPYVLLREVQPQSWPLDSRAVYGPAVEHDAHDLRLFGLRAGDSHADP